MTIPESVRQALQRLRQVVGVKNMCPWESPVYSHTTMPRSAFMADCRDAVQLVLSDHLSDDSEPVTEEWLVENGFMFNGKFPVWGVEIRRNLFLALSLESSLVWLCKDCPIDGEFVEVAENPTRGQVRKLISALKGE